MIVSASGPTKKYAMPTGKATAANARQMIASPRRAGRGEDPSIEVGTSEVGAGIPFEDRPSRARAEAPLHGRPAHPITGASYPFYDSRAGGCPAAIMRRVADATRMTCLGFGTDDAKLF
jgi:hypothetical protein